MIGFKIATLSILLISFIFGVLTLWKKGKPLYFQIIVCSIGCFLLFYLTGIVMSYCNINEIYFNTSFFGLLGCNIFLFCANRGAIEKLFDKPKTKYIIISAMSGLLQFGISFVVGFFCFKPTNFVFYLFVAIQIPLAFVVYFVVKRLLSQNDELGLKNGLLLNDIFILLYCVFVNLDILSWLKIGILSGVGDLLIALIILGLSYTSAKGAKKWNF